MWVAGGADHLAAGQPPADPAAASGWSARSLDYQPGEAPLDLPRKLGPATEIQELRDAFARAVDRVEESEREMAGALEGQRRLVREVHHRVKNNLQVVASLLNIHGRSAETPEARAAYAGISRRVGALSIVHRNHFAEMEENRGIALRPLLSELAAELRAGAPEDGARAARSISTSTRVYTTQDVAVAVAFLITEIVEFAMLNAPEDPIEISLRRTSELTARLTLSSPVLDPGRGRRAGKSAVRAHRRRAGQAAALARSTASLAATALICRYFRRPETARQIVTAASEKMFRNARN